MKEQLTRSYQRAYSGSRAPNRGNIFMDGNQNEVMKTGNAETPKAPVTKPQPGAAGPEAPKTPQWSATGQQVESPDQRWLREHGINPQGEEKPSREMPEFKQARHEALQKGEFTVSGASDFDLEIDTLLHEGEISDPDLRRFIDSRRGMPETQESFNRTVEELEQIYRSRRDQIVRVQEQLVQAGVGASEEERERLEGEIMGYQNTLRDVERQIGNIRSATLTYADEIAERDLAGRIARGEVESPFAGMDEEDIQLLQQWRGQVNKRDQNEIREFIRNNREVLRRLVENSVESASRAERVPRDVRNIVVNDDELSEMYLEQIISLPDATPGDGYRINFYAESELEGFLQQVRSHDRINNRGEDRYKYYSTLRSLRLRFHEGYRAMKTGGGDLESFLRIVPEIEPHHIQTHTEVIGVDMIERLYERGLQRILSEKGVIQGEDFTEVERWVEGHFRRLAQQQNFYDGRAGQEKYRQIEDWEISRALTLGRNFSFINYRGVEYVGMGGIVDFPESKRWVSFPFEYPVRALQFMKWVGYRMKAGPLWEETSRIVRDEFHNAKHSGKKREDLLRKIGGVDREQFELSGMLKAKGLISSWRTSEAYLNTIMIRLEPDNPDNPNRKEHKELIGFMNRSERQKRFEMEKKDGIYMVPLGYYIDAIDAFLDPSRAIEDKEKYGRNDKKYYGDEKDELKTKYWEAVVEQVHFFLGDLVTRAPDSGTTKAQLWEKVAVRVPVRMMYLLDDQISSELRTGFKSIEDKLIALEEDRVIRGDTEEVEFEITVVEKGRPKRITIKAPKLYIEDLTETEREAYRSIVELGYNNAKGLAEIAFPYTAFMDDFRLNKGEDYNGPKYLKWGDAVMPRRYASDLAGMYKAGGAILNIQANPTRPLEELRKDFKTAVDNIANQEGAESAQEILEPFVRTFAKLAETYKRAKIPFVTWFYALTGDPSSTLQGKGGGRDTHSLDEFGLDNLFEALTTDGVLRRHRKADQRPVGKVEWLLGATPLMGEKWVVNVLKKAHAPKKFTQLFERDNLSQLEQIKKDFGVRGFNFWWYWPRRVSDGGIVAMLIEFFKSLFKA